VAGAYHRAVEIVLAVLLGLVLGLTYAPAAKWIYRRASAGEFAPTDKVPVVSGQLGAAVDLLRSATLVAGPYDEVLHSNPPARAIGLVRGTRVAHEEVLELVRDARHRGNVAATVIQVRREPGSPPLELAVRVASLNDGIMLVIADDRSAQLRTDEIKRDFVANVSHELKTPVGAMRVLAEAVEQAAEDPDAVRKFSTRMVHESERLGELIGQLISLSRLESDDPLTSPEVVQIDDVVVGATAQCRELATSRSVTLNVAGAPGLEVLGDEDQLTSALANLLVNAINYSEPGARVALSTRQTADAGDTFVEISVADNGIGIRSEELERIFERFYRVDYARSREHGGTGLGLSIVKHVIVAHGGTVNVWSKPGQGSTFTIRLPAHEEPPNTGGMP
jgi:two-component system sensor histidine kinase SenX3